jgi:hypothetical protein
MANRKIAIRAISDLGAITEIKNEWNSTVQNYSNDPFLFNEFVKQLFASGSFYGWTPLIASCQTQL